MSVKPAPMSCVYDVQSLKKWLHVEAPRVLVELVAVLRGCERPNGTLEFFSMKDYADGMCGDTLSPESIAWLRENIGEEFAIYNWW